ncbi:MAG: hypothetical protein RLZ51_1614 [Pseudomonadota bacterium]
MTGKRRWWRHLLMTPWQVHHSFDAAALQAIQTAITQSETHHSAEIRFAVEAVLTPAELWAGLSARDRAWQVFAEQGIWNTEHNNGVLIYLLWADRAVEIVVDRGAHRAVPESTWSEACLSIREALRAGRGAAGVIAAIEQMSVALGQAFPARPEGNTIDNPDELPNAPIVLR